MTKKGLFTLEEVNYIKSRYFYETCAQIAKSLNRSERSVEAKIRRMKLHKTTFSLPETLQEKIRERAETTTFTLEQIANEFGLSRYRIRKILKRLGVKRRRFGWHRNRDLLRGFSYKGNKIGKTRAQCLWAYKNTCWDCKKTMLPNMLVVHHDWASLPIKMLVLCRDCHRKRHGINSIPS